MIVCTRTAAPVAAAHSSATQVLWESTSCAPVHRPMAQHRMWIGIDVSGRWKVDCKILTSQLVALESRFAAVHSHRLLCISIHHEGQDAIFPIRRRSLDLWRSLCEYEYVSASAQS